MRQNTSQPIQMQEPALNETKTRPSWVMSSCITGAGCIIFFIAAVYIIFKLVIGNGPTITTNLPVDFPKDIPQDNADSITRIVIIEKSAKTRALWVATALPRLMLAPVLREIDPDAPIAEEQDATGRTAFVRDLGVADYVRYLSLPAGSADQKTVAITWNHRAGTPQVAADYLAKELAKADYTIATTTTRDAATAGFTFAKNEISGVYRAVDVQPDQSGIEFIQLIVNYP